MRDGFMVVLRQAGVLERALTSHLHLPRDQRHVREAAASLRVGVEDVEDQYLVAAVPQMTQCAEEIIVLADILEEIRQYHHQRSAANTFGNLAECGRGAGARGFLG